MQQKEVMPTDMKVLMNHIYEYKKGVRRMVLFTFTGDNGYPEASFKAKEAMKNLKKMIVRTYRIDDYDVQKKEYTVLHNSSQRDITIYEPLKKFY